MQSQPVTKRAYRIKEFCEAFGISRASAYNEMNAGRLPFVFACSVRLIPVDAAEQWLHAKPGMGTGMDRPDNAPGRYGTNP